MLRYSIFSEILLWISMCRDITTSKSSNMPEDLIKNPHSYFDQTNSYKKIFRHSQRQESSHFYLNFIVGYLHYFSKWPKVSENLQSTFTSESKAVTAVAAENALHGKDRHISSTTSTALFQEIVLGNLV